MTLFWEFFPGLCFGAAAVLCIKIAQDAEEARIQAEYRLEIEQIIKETDRLLSKPDPTRDKTGALGWDCMEKGHVIVLGAGHCLKCKKVIG